MYICLVIAILSTLMWIDTLSIESINARVNPYQKSEEDKSKDHINALKRTISLIISALFWAAVIVFWK